ncbi:hypothetical protein [Modestobacter marinus]|uniref:Uncharacterized protein n=1 Tax=Modestobacter marinus TaxID=477641 RepID=A0A846LU02_9ACTN|nr:hypothetical protein [Modestobacter marinus]NIH68938.1 hypothetical protein [Modestobacter marinus]
MDPPLLGTPWSNRHRGGTDMGIVSGLIKANLLKRLLSRFTGGNRTK